MVKDPFGVLDCSARTPHHAILCCSEFWLLTWDLVCDSHNGIVARKTERAADLMEIYVSSEEAVVEAASVNVWTRVNKWLKTTKGIWISILQDGDVILPDFYSQFRAHLMAKEFASEQKLGLAFCAVKLLYGDKLAWAWITTTALVPEFLQKVSNSVQTTSSRVTTGTGDT